MREVGIKAGLRIDVDTLRGTRLGVPNLLQVLSQNQIKQLFSFQSGLIIWGVISYVCCALLS